MNAKDQRRAEFLLYKEKVQRLSEKTFKKQAIYLKELRGSDWELDHRLSIYDGFQNEVPVEIMSHPCNLEIISKDENRQKSRKSVITFEELIREIADSED